MRQHSSRTVVATREVTLPQEGSDTSAYPAWARRRDVTFTLFLWIIMGLAFLFATSFIIRPVLIVALACLLAYAVAPLVRTLARVLPRSLAILGVYLALLAVIGGLGYLFVSNAIVQFSALGTQITQLLTPPSTGAPTPLTQQLEQLGFSQSQIQDVSRRAIQELQSAAQNALPVLGSVVNGLLSALLDIVLVLVLSLYALIEGPRLIDALRSNAPVRYRPRIGLVIGAVARVVGGYIRGQLILSSLIGVLVGVGMELLGVPYAILLGLMAFLLEFIPTLGTLLSGVICILVALTQGWLLALLVLAYFVLIHLLEGYVVAPRVLAKAIGLHPAASIIALLVGAELFGVWGALFAAPVAGLLQALIVALWEEWRQAHPTQFPEEFGPAVVPVTTAEALGLAVTTTPAALD